MRRLLIESGCVQVGEQCEAGKKLVHLVLRPPAVMDAANGIRGIETAGLEYSNYCDSVSDIITPQRTPCTVSQLSPSFQCATYNFLP